MEIIWALQKAKAKVLQGKKGCLTWLVKVDGIALQITSAARREKQVTGAPP